MAEEKQSSESKNPVLKGILYFFGGLLILVIIAQIVLIFFADDYAANYLKEKVHQSSNQAYTIDFDDLSLNIFRGAATIENLSISADTIAFAHKTSPTSKPPQTLFRGTVGQIDVSGINILSSLWGDRLSISSIIITEPDLAALKNPRDIKQDSSQQSTSLDSFIYSAISNRYSTLQINDFTIRNGRGQLIQSEDTLSTLGNLNLNLRAIRVDSASARSGRRFITDNFSTEAEKLMIKMPDSLNILRLGRLIISSDEKTLSVDSLQLIPRYPRFDFGYKNEYEIDRIDLTIPEIRLRDIDYNRYIDSARFYARSAHINNARMVDFRNKNLPFPPDNDPPLPHTALKNMAQKIKIDSLQINDAYIEYNEYWYEAPQAGTLTFEELDAAIYGLSNYTEDIERGSEIVMDARTRVMGKGLLEAHFEFPMNTQIGFHRVSGTLGQMDLTAFNPIIEYVAFARIDRGMLNSLQFDMTLTDTRSNGTLIMNYENFKISLLDRQTIEQQGIINDLGSFIANTFIIKKNNTPEGGMRAGPINFERIQRKAVFNYWWKSLLSGIKPSLGL